MQMSEIPIAVQQYLASEDDWFRHGIIQQNPRLVETLTDPGTRRAIVDWLSSDAAYAEAQIGLAVNYLKFLRPAARPDEASAIRTLLLHPNLQVRLCAYEFLLTLYFPDKNREALLGLLTGMLSDAEDAVRAEAAQYIERANATAELKDFLQRWIRMAVERGWGSSESYEIVVRLLNP
jgi:hypothetical protein